MPTADKIKKQVDAISDKQLETIIQFCDHPQSDIIIDYLEERKIFQDFHEYMMEKTG